MTVLQSSVSREAVTHYEVLERYEGITYLQFRLETGRTHQIRVHLAHIGHPLVGTRCMAPVGILLKGSTLPCCTDNVCMPML